MTAEDLFINDCRNRQTIKAICKSFPQLDVITSFACREKKDKQKIMKCSSNNRVGEGKKIENRKLTFIIEAIDSINARTFVIATKQEKILWILDFVCK